MGLHNALASLEAFSPERSHDLSHDFGVVYASSAIQPDAQAPATEDGAVVEATPGARAPHAWVSHAGERRSTIDLFEGRLTLLAGPGGTPGTTPSRTCRTSRCRCSSSGRTSSTPMARSSGATASARPTRCWSAPTATSPGGWPPATCAASSTPLTTTLGGRPAVTV